MKKTRIYLVCILVFILLIFSFSLNSGGSSHTESETLRNLLRPIAHSIGLRNVNADFINRFYHYKDVSASELLLRKFAHMTEYLMLGLLAGMFTATLPRSRKNGLVCLIGPGVALVDERLIQAYLSVGRTSSFLDVGIDSLGFYIGLLLALICAWIVKFLRRQNGKRADPSLSGPRQGRAG